MGDVQPKRHSDVKGIAVTSVSRTAEGCVMEIEMRLLQSKGRISACSVGSDRPLLDVRCYGCKQELREQLS